MSSPSRFATLGIAPTLDAAAVKRAYFQQLALHPPHQDPQGFRRLRSDYEALQQPGALAAAYLESPLDIATELAPYSARFDAALADARRRSTAQVPRSRQFVELVAPLTYQETTRRFR